MPTLRLWARSKRALSTRHRGRCPDHPIVIHNSGDIMWRSAMLRDTGTIEVTVLQPVDTANWRVEHIDQYITQLREGLLHGQVTTLTCPPNRFQSLQLTGSGCGCLVGE